jgi:hypothetical protein
MVVKLESDALGSIGEKQPYDQFPLGSGRSIWFSVMDCVGRLQ